MDITAIIIGSDHGEGFGERPENVLFCCGGGSPDDAQVSAGALTAQPADPDAGREIGDPLRRRSALGERAVERRARASRG